MDNRNELRLLADKCRRLAGALTDGPAQENLNSLASEYEERAAEADESPTSDPTIEQPLPPQT